MVRVRSDEQLARQAAKGDRRAFASIYARHHDALYRYCLTIVRNQDDARDVLQSVMANALAALTSSNPPVPDAPLRPWLFRITHNEAISALRRRRPTAELSDEVVPRGVDLEATVEQRARLRQLVADLQSLPERQRGALVMRELSGLSHAEIAAALDISSSQAKQAILEARVSLQEAEKGRALRCADVRTVISAQDGRRLRARTVRAHLRSCDDCRALRDAISMREADLRALAPPIPAALSAGLLAQLLGGGGGSIAAKAAVGAAIVATVGGGGVAVTSAVRHSDRAQASERRAAPTPAANTATTPAAAVIAKAVEAADQGRATSGGRKRTRIRLRGDRTGAPKGLGQGSSTDKSKGGGAPGGSGSPAQDAPGQRAKPERTRPSRVAKPGKPSRPAKKPRPTKHVKPARTPRPVRTPAPQRTPTPKPERTATPGPEQTATPTPSATPEAGLDLPGKGRVK